VRKYHNLTLEKFAAPIGYKGNSLSRIENGEREVADKLIISICKEYHVSEAWLRTGEGAMFVTVEDAVDNGDLDDFFARVKGQSRNGFERRFVSALAKLRPEQWAEISNLIDEIKDGGR